MKSVKTTALYITLLVSQLSLSQSAFAATDELRVAVAANFRAPLQQLIGQYQKQQSQQQHPVTDIKVSSGSSGSLYQQVIHGAPYQIFLSANARYPLELQQNGLIAEGYRHTYARGELVVWQPKLPLTQLTDLTSGAIQTSRYPRLTIAIANPKTAPYGQAAQQLLEQLQIDKNIKVIRAHSIAQAHQFIASGNAQAAFLARSQVLEHSEQVLSIDPSLYSPIEQQMVLLKKHSAAALDFYQYLLSAAAQRLIVEMGYQAPASPKITKQQSPQAQPESNKQQRESASVTR